MPGKILYHFYNEILNLVRFFYNDLSCGSKSIWIPARSQSIFIFDHKDELKKQFAKCAVKIFSDFYVIHSFADDFTKNFIEICELKIAQENPNIVKDMLDRWAGKAEACLKKFKVINFYISLFF